ncbi:hypothetical protein ACEZCY_10545 [Streptacidiphilus sp. N1-12]|uniref:Uncharacterized protein n=2 Tax=Streptacidiphilus alkalitolerans TaxID=3342712 RepID=A0ABV6WCH8_9ACTN
MSETSPPTKLLVDAVVRNAGRATLPFQQAHTGDHYATAFWYNDLVDATPGTEQVRQYLVTATAGTHFTLAQWTLRPELCQPQMSAELLLMPDFEDQWTALAALGVSVMPSEGLHQHAARKGWQWATDEVTEGIGATPADLAVIGSAPVASLVLGHDVGPAGERLQVVVVGSVSRGVDGTLRWDRAMPDGCVGAPVFIGLPRGEGEWKLVCLGVVLPGPGLNVIAPFDHIRVAVRALVH